MKMLILGLWLSLPLPSPALPPSRELVAFGRARLADHKELRTLEKFSTGPDRMTAERLVAISDQLGDSTNYALVTNDANKAEILQRVEDCLLGKAANVALLVRLAEVEKGAIQKDAALAVAAEKLETNLRRLMKLITPPER